MRASRRISDGYARVFGRICRLATLDSDARSRSGQAHHQGAHHGHFRFADDHPPSSRRGALIAGLALTGCQTAGEHVVARGLTTSADGASAPGGIDVHRPADRVAEDIERNQDRMDELAKRFAGVLRTAWRSSSRGRPPRPGSTEALTHRFRRVHAAGTQPGGVLRDNNGCIKGAQVPASLLGRIALLQVRSTSS